MIKDAGELLLAIEKRLSGQAPREPHPKLTLLIERASAGDTQAFEQIMIYCEQKVLMTTWRLLGNEADARDAAQEVFLRVYKYLGRFKQDQDFFAWLYQITLNVCRDIARKRQQRNTHFTSFDTPGDQGTLGALAVQGDSEESALLAQRRQMISDAMATLPEKERAAIVLRDMEGLSTEEVARLMKSSTTTVRSQISSARKKIKLYCDRYLRRKER